jgi:adenylate kinase family enzyme
MGPQACGKGTQGRLLSEALKVPLVTNGEILRSLPENHPQKKLFPHK